MSSAPSSFSSLETLLAKLAAEGDDFRGLEDYRAEVHSVFGGDGSVCVVWTLYAAHGTKPSVGGPAAGVRPFLGWYPTGRSVRIPVVSLTRAKNVAKVESGKGWHHEWDRLGALAQIGVRAVGRPVLRADNALDR